MQENKVRVAVYMQVSHTASCTHIPNHIPPFYRFGHWHMALSHKDQWLKSSPTEWDTPSTTTSIERSLDFSRHVVFSLEIQPSSTVMHLVLTLTGVSVLVGSY